ncbi:MAG: 2-polyprenyl-3-methyl-6-methoxy-1,4-benzoquinone monooxygenase [Gammaproteobacteria bacterium]|nr:2-polyprenyl-3-methyl-6-methoxy-1,4-benzoquinone monooxygenase [Gammaproteobacteria bacterium]MDE0451517.1 2-polyprenyl-3-methyl-6-methoxy-1,4-benzoquinone monooxygenase [Gammaproteobacteria bacterium]
MSGTDDLIGVFDRALRALTGGGVAERPAPEAEEGSLTESERRHAAGLMRVNHAGEICAQALYEGQALTARDPEVREALRTAAGEENDHLAWCRERLDELDGRPSLLDPVFYAASFALGAAVGVLGDKVSLGFVEATEDQVKRHLDSHIRDLPESDERSRAILEEMRADESRHGENARREGGVEFPEPVKEAMTLASKLMTESTYRI